MNKNAAAAASTFASISNIALALKLADGLVKRPQNQPGLGVFHGFSGLGKSMALNYIHAKQQGKTYYVAVKSYETKKSFLVAIADEMGIAPGRATIPDLVGLIADQLTHSGKLLLIDDAHYLINRNIIELVKDLYESAFSPILLAAEERFPSQLKKYEQVHNRVLYWQAAEPCGLSDARKLAQLYARPDQFADDWLEQCCKAVRGITRRVCTNITNAVREAEDEGYRGQVSLKWWGDRPFPTGEAPKPRASL